MLAAKGQHIPIPGMRFVPPDQILPVEIIIIIPLQLLDTGTRYIEQIDLHLRTGHTILRALDYILLTASARLNHLVHRAVAMLGQEALAENDGHLEECVGFLVEIEVFPVGRAAKNGVVGVIFHRMYFC